MIQISEFKDKWGHPQTVYSETFPTISDMIGEVSKRDYSPNLDIIYQLTHDFLASDFDVSSDRRTFFGASGSKEGREKTLYGTAPKAMTKRLKEYRKDIQLTQVAPTECEEYLPMGGIISIPKYLSHSPTPYYVLYEDDREVKSIKVAVDMWTYFDVSATKISKACENILAVLTKLDVQGWNIGLTIVNTGESRGSWYSVGAEVKKVSDELNIDRAYQLLGTPIFQRMMSWGWRARNPYWTSDDTNSNQPAISVEDRTRFYKETYQVDKAFRIMDVVNKISVGWEPERIQDWLVGILTQD